MNDTGTPLSAAELAVLRRDPPPRTRWTQVVKAAPKPVMPAKPKARKAPKRKAGRPRKPDPAAFDAVKFHQELRAVARSLDVKSMDTVAADTGVRVQAIHGMKKGLAPTLAECLLLCDWAGMNPLQYLLRLAPSAANDQQERTAA